MPQADVQVRYINQPTRPDQKTGQIKSVDGDDKWRVPRTHLGMLKEGGTYRFFYEDTTFKGAVYHIVSRVNELAPPSPQQGPIGQTTGPIQRARTNEADAERMWTCALLVAAIGAGQIHATNHSEVVENGKAFLEDLKLIFSEETPHPVGAQVTPQAGNSSAAPRPASVTPASPAGQQQWSEEYGDQIPF